MELAAIMMGVPFTVWLWRKEIINLAADIVMEIDRRRNEAL